MKFDLRKLAVRHVVASTDADRPTISRLFSRLCVEPNGDVVATNGHILLIASNSKQEKEVKPKGERVFIRGESLRDVIANRRDRGKSMPDTVEVNASEIMIRFGHDGTTEPFPNYSNVLPVGPYGVHRMCIAVEVLEGLCRAARELYSENRPIYFEFPEKPTNPVRVFIYGDDTNDVDLVGVLMPMRQDEFHESKGLPDRLKP